jgi:ferredoxin-NADP reductase
MSAGLDPSEALLDLTVAEARPLSSHITAFRLRHPDRRALPGDLAGAHIKVRVEIDGQARWRHYSLINLDAAADASERPSEYLIAVRREDAVLGGRGGSLYMHTQLKAGDMLQVSSPINGFRLDPAHDNVVLIAIEMIGVTPIISMATALRTAGKRYAMHYSGRSADQLALAPELQGVAADALTLYADDDEAPARSGHVSQVPNKGDFYATDVARQPVIMVRHQDDSVRVMMNRCAHKGARLVSDICGNTGKFFRCPYHAWTYKTDGSLLAIPLKNAYEKTGLSECQSSKGLALVANMEIYRGFVFVRFAQEGPSFNEYFGDSCPPSTTWLTAHPRANSKSPAAACVTCTTVTGKCSSRT